MNPNQENSEKQSCFGRHAEAPKNVESSGRSTFSIINYTSSNISSLSETQHGSAQRLTVGGQASRDNHSDSEQGAPGLVDRVYPIRSVISVGSASSPFRRKNRADGYLSIATRLEDGRRVSLGGSLPDPKSNSQGQDNATDHESSSRKCSVGNLGEDTSRDSSAGGTLPFSPDENSQGRSRLTSANVGSNEVDNEKSNSPNQLQPPQNISSRQSSQSLANDSNGDEKLGNFVTSRYKHIVTEGGHTIITGRDGETLQRCEDEPIHIPGAVQGFGMLAAFEISDDEKLCVRVVSENSQSFIGYSPKELFALESFSDILNTHETENMLDHIDYVRDKTSDVGVNGPEVFILTIVPPGKDPTKYWCAIHASNANRGLVICEFERENDKEYPLAPLDDQTLQPPEDTIDSQPTDEELVESTRALSRPLRLLRGERKRNGEVGPMEVFNVMSQVQEQLSDAPDLDKFLKVLVGIMKEMTGFHRVMIYQFDQTWNGKVVTELVDPRATKDMYKGLHFPASDIPKQARELYKINKVRLLYDRDMVTARLVCRSLEDLNTPLDLTHSYLRAMSPIHLKYLRNMAVRSSMSVSINAFGELWGLVACHSYGSKGRRVSFPIRKMCRMVGDTASQNVERLSYASRLQARKLINTIPTKENPSGYIIASSEDLLQLFDADVGVLAIQDETKILGEIEETYELLALVEYLRMKKFASVFSTNDITQDFSDLSYDVGFKVIAGVLLVPLSGAGHDYIAFFRKAQVNEVKWAGNPYEKYQGEGKEGYLEPRKSFKLWKERVTDKSREWTEDKIETAAMLCLVYGKFIEVWRQKEAAMKKSQLTRLLLANTAHEVRTPLNAIINYLEIALEGQLDPETRENLSKSHSASKSLIYVINDLLDLTRSEEGVDLVKEEEFELKSTLYEAILPFEGDAKRKSIGFNFKEAPDLPKNVIGDPRKVRQALANVVANAIQNTIKGEVAIYVHVAARTDGRVEIEVLVRDTGCGISPRKLDELFRELEQVQYEPNRGIILNNDQKEGGGAEGEKSLGLGLAVVARIIRNVNGQLRVQSEEGKGSRFVLMFPFDLPPSEARLQTPNASSSPLSTPSDSTSGSHSEVTLIKNNAEVRKTSPEMSFPRDGGSDKLRTRHSARALRADTDEVAARSSSSKVDRLFDAIKEPHLLERPACGRQSSLPERSRTTTTYKAPVTAMGSIAMNIEGRGGASSMPPFRPSSAHSSVKQSSAPGERAVMDSGVPIRAVKVLNEESSSVDRRDGRQQALPASSEGRRRQSEKNGGRDPNDTNAESLRVLVAEDDPVNSKIVKKRLEKAGHVVYLTVNGEECAATYGERAGHYDVVLMDMQVSARYLFSTSTVSFVKQACEIYEKSLHHDMLQR